jgi:hypothetical protein
VQRLYNDSSIQNKTVTVQLSSRSEFAELVTINERKWWNEVQKNTGGWPVKM